MSRRILVLIITASALCLTVPCSGRQHSELPRKWQPVDRRLTQSALMDPCQKERNMKMICHCKTIEDKQTDEVQAAECWILKSNFTIRDPLWKALDTYASMADLKFIVQSGSLNFIPNLSKLVRLSHLSISFSNISTIQSYAFANLSSLRTIRMNHNNLSEIERLAFANHPKLERIDLQENGLSKVDRDSFSNLSRLEYLALNNNELARVQGGTFRFLNNLAELQLQHNWVSVIEPEMFLGLTNMRVLKLSSNKIHALENGAFAELWSLQELYLDNNKIEKVFERAFDGLNNLRRLSLQRNHLKHIEKGIFHSLPVLSWLNLADNRLKTLHQETFSHSLENFVKTESHLDLNGNEFTCDCTLNWLIELRRRTKSMDSQQSLGKLKCVLSETNGIAEDLLLQAMAGGGAGSEDDYVTDEVAPTQVHSVDLEGGPYVNLFLLEKIPCRESDPTSLPLPRESTGFKDDATTLKTPVVLLFTAFVTLYV